MTIIDIVYYWSRFSRNCLKISQLINASSVPIRNVCVDSARVKAAIRTGKYFKVDAVPTITIRHDDGNLDIYKGNDALRWAESMIHSPQAVEEVTLAPPQGAERAVEDGDEYQLLEDDVHTVDDTGKLDVQTIMKNAEKRRKAHDDSFS
uniref:Thioredoxin domain-containing protein n=1 Tax=viral metagenome TaxID=1070528 RepID=A0A6C0LZP9_9ZZZZ